MVKLTKAQKKKLKTHAANQSARHMKTMVALMRNGESFSEAHKQASKQKQKQKQSQSQKQSVVINLQSPKKRATKPRASARGGSSRVLSQFIQPAQVLPDYRTMINPAPMPMPFMSPMQSATPTATATSSTQTSPINEGRILGRGDPLETPLEVSNVLKSIKDADKLLSGKKEKDNTSTQGRTLVPEIRPPIFDYATDYDRTSDLDVMDQVRMKQLKKQIDNEDINEPLTNAEQRRMQGLRKEVAKDVLGDILLSGRKKPDNTSTQGRTLLPDTMWRVGARGDVGISSLSDTEPSYAATRGLGRVEEETSDEEGFGGGRGIPSPSLMRRY